MFYGKKLSSNSLFLDATFDENRCHFKVGYDAKGGKEDKLGKTGSANLCLAEVMKYKKERPDYGVNGATWGEKSKKCYAEREATEPPKYDGWWGETLHSCVFAGKTLVSDINPTV